MGYTSGNLLSTTKTAAKKAGLFYFVFVMFAYTTGGPFGMEGMVTTSGPGLTLLYLLVIPLFWCIPVSLVAAELTTAIPVEGGFYRWVRAGYGDFWGFLAGWWNWSASWLLGGSYAVLFSDYLGGFFPSLVGWKHYLVSVALIALLAYVNIRGIQMVGIVSTVLEFSVLMPVLALCVDRGDEMAFQSGSSVCAAACAAVPGVRRRAGAGIVAVFGLRAVFERGGGD